MYNRINYARNIPGIRMTRESKRMTGVVDRGGIIGGESNPVRTRARAGSIQALSMRYSLMKPSIYSPSIDGMLNG